MNIIMTITLEVIMLKNGAGVFLGIGAASCGYFKFREHQATDAIANNKLCVHQATCSALKNPPLITTIINAPYGTPGDDRILPGKTICRITEDVSNRGLVPYVARTIKPEIDLVGPYAEHPAALPIVKYSKLCGKIRPILNLINYDPLEVLQKTQKVWEVEELKSLELGHFSKLEGIEEAENALPPELKGKIPYLVEVIKLRVLLSRRLPPSQRTSQIHQTYLKGPNAMGPQVKKSGAIGVEKGEGGTFHIATEWGPIEIGKTDELKTFLKETADYLSLKGPIIAFPQQTENLHYLFRCYSKKREVEFKKRCELIPSKKIEKDWNLLADVVFWRVNHQMEPFKESNSFIREKLKKAMTF